MNKLIDTFKQKFKSIDIIPSLKSDISNLKTAVSEIKVLQGRQLALANRVRFKEIKENINDAEFKVFSQWGDDGIIQFLIDYLEIENRTFIEFGVENYTESNTRFLLINNCWKGLIIDGSAKHIEEIKQSDIYWKYLLTAHHSFITAENINELLSANNFTKEVGLLVVDIDGNDYWVWEAINVIEPIIVCVEYNSLFGCERAITIPYDKSFVRGNAHFSNLYAGASLPALCHLASIKGYKLVACNTNGNNAYFVRNDKVKDLIQLNCKNGYKKATFRESRNEANKLTYLNFEDAALLIKGQPVVNVKTGQTETF
jgi:hypothetical protein